jgi:hypothetical protein
MVTVERQPVEMFCDQHVVSEGVLDLDHRIGGDRRRGRWKCVTKRGNPSMARWPGGKRHDGTPSGDAERVPAGPGPPSGRASRSPVLLRNDLSALDRSGADEGEQLQLGVQPRVDRRRSAIADLVSRALSRARGAGCVENQLGRLPSTCSEYLLSRLARFTVHARLGRPGELVDIG